MTRKVNGVERENEGRENGLEGEWIRGRMDWRENGLEGEWRKGNEWMG